MEKIKTFELDRWSEPDEQHRVRHIGMADAKETFEKLEAHLKEKGMLPDEYFLYDVDMRTKTRELPDFNFALCVPNFGGSEGIYLDIDLIYCDEDGEQKSLRFATGKTLQEGADAFFWMSRIAAECSLMLNGRGRTYEKHNVELVLKPEEAEAVEYFAKLLRDRASEEAEAEDEAWSRKILFFRFLGKRLLRGRVCLCTPALTPSSAWWLRRE